MTNIYAINNWNFNKEVSEEFDLHVRQSIPLYNEFQKLTIKIAEFFIRNNDIIYDLGCATGETAYLINKKNDENAKKKIKLILIDNSKDMLNKAKQKCSYWNNIEYIKDDIKNIKFKNTNLIISLFTLHFLTINDRIDVLKNIYDGLNSGGALILAEKTYAGNSANNDIFTQIYHDFKEENGLTAFDISEKDKSLRSVLIPLSFEENIELLKETGFKRIDIFMKYLNFTGFIAIKH